MLTEKMPIENMAKLLHGAVSGLGFGLAGSLVGGGTNVQTIEGNSTQNKTATVNTEAAQKKSTAETGWTAARAYSEEEAGGDSKRRKVISQSGCEY